MRLAPLARAVPRLDVARFRAGAEGHVVAVEGGRQPLAPVRVHRRGAAGYEELPPTLAPIQRPIGMPDHGPGFGAASAYPDMLVARLREATCVPGGVVLHRGCVLDCSFTAPWDTSQHRHLVAKDAGRFELVDRGPASLLPASTRIAGPVFYLDQEHIDWFGHFLLDLLPRLWGLPFARAFLGLEPAKILLSAPLQPWSRDLLQAAGFAEADIVLIDRPVLCEELIVASKALQIQDYVAPPAQMVWRPIRDRVVAPGSPTPPDIYVSRRANPTRPLAEEAFVEAFFVERGFLRIFPEHLSIADQIRVFAGARRIVGCSGSNMFGLAWAGAALRHVLLLASPLLLHHSEHFLLTGTGARLDIVIGEADAPALAARPGYVHVPWHLDAPAFAAFAQDWLDAST